MRVFISVIMICTLLVSIFTCSVNNVHAKKTNLSQEEISVLKQNILYKAIYANLIKCYSEMKSSFDESSIDTSISYNSDTYFSEQSLDK